jgi:hypothetical protein
MRFLYLKVLHYEISKICFCDLFVLLIHLKEKEASIQRLSYVMG